MKTLSIIAALCCSIFISNVTVAQKNNVKKDTTRITSKYSCPMDPEVTGNQPGKCSKCGMDLVKSKKEAMKMEDGKMYCCSMHPDVKSDQPGTCSKCGMNLTLSKKEQMKTQSMYKCPMHPDVTSDKSGKCSKCGMALKKS